MANLPPALRARLMKRGIGVEEEPEEEPEEETAEDKAATLAAMQAKIAAGLATAAAAGVEGVAPSQQAQPPRGLFGRRGWIRGRGTRTGTTP